MSEIDYTILKLNELEEYDRKIIETLNESYGFSLKSAFTIFMIYKPALDLIGKYDNAEFIADILMDKVNKKITVEEWLEHINELRNMEAFLGEARKFTAPEIIPEANFDDRAHFLMKENNCGIDIDEIQQEFENVFDDNYTLAEWARHSVPDLISEIEKLYQLVGKLVSQMDT